MTDSTPIAVFDEDGVHAELHPRNPDQRYAPIAEIIAALQAIEGINANARVHSIVIAPPTVPNDDDPEDYRAEFDIITPASEQ